MTKKQKKMLTRILGSIALYILGILLPLEEIPLLVLYLAAYFLVGWDVLWCAIRNIFGGQVFDEHFLMAVATIGAFALDDYKEGVAVMLFYQVGELFQSYAVGKSRQSIASLMDIRPDYANIERGGTLEQVDPEEVSVGDVIVVKPGEKIPLDGIIIEGSSSLNTAALTGESAPRDVKPGDEIISGCINLSGLMRVRTSKEFGESTVSKILDLVENSSAKKAKAENFITKFARYYTPAVVFGAVALAVILPFATGISWGDSIRRALIFLVISCPCALVISIPLSFFGGIGGASRQGILVKGGNYLEALAATEMVVFDKTGTLTKGAFQVTETMPQGCTEQQLLELAALAECFSEHPISRSIREAYGGKLDHARVSEVEDYAGFGVSAKVDGRQVLAGNRRLMEREGILCPPVKSMGTVVYLAAGGAYAGYIVISDEVKPDAADAIQKLHSMGVRRNIMLTGDRKDIGEYVAGELGLDEVHAELLPADKVDCVEKLLQQKSARGVLAFVGDGVNDAPVLSRADVGIAMGGLGSDAAIEAADVVLMDDRPSKLSDAIRIAKKTLRIVRQNIVFALGVKLLVLALGAYGMANMWEAVFADVGVAVIAILNASRMLRGVSREA